jgi:hypothetical protein
MKKYFSLQNLMLMAAFFVLENSVYSQFKIDAEYRPRFEIRDGYQSILPAGSNPAYIVTQRTRLNFIYESAAVKIKFTPQDVRIWGGEQSSSSTGVFGDKASLDLFEAFAEIKMTDGFWVSVGRQQLVYDNKRLLGDRNWNQSGISYDALVLKYNRDKLKLHAGSSWLTFNDVLSENAYPSSRIKSLSFLWLNYKWTENWKMSLMHIASGVTETDSTNGLNFRQTTGIFTELKVDKLKFWGDFYYQYGRNQARKQISAFLVDGDLSYRMGKFTLGAGVSYLSGNNKTGDEMTTDKLFDVLYGNRHKFFGLIDYFRDFHKNTKEGGLADYFAYLDYKISDKISCRNTGHYFRLDKTNALTLSDKNLGYENDFIITYNFAEWGSVEGGYLFMLPTNTLKTIQNITDSRFAQFIYVQLSVTPKIFKEK